MLNSDGSKDLPRIDEGHGLVKRANRLIAYPAIARFLDTYVHR